MKAPLRPCDASHLTPRADPPGMNAAFAASSPAEAAREAVGASKYRELRDLRQNCTAMYGYWHNPSHDD
ncbi:hypothetical protein [Streptomyces sp900116325]|uniref:hypothetical protein n=1 Tax=Streptomyces sp. 900116325 TaxID=3154295 RepID=UPI003320C5CE